MADKDQKQRLTELLEESARKMDCPQMDEVADYLLTNGVIVPPCKIGEHGYWVTTRGIMTVTFDRIFLGVGDVWNVRARYHCSESVYFTFEDFGKKVFHSFKEAEKALAERSGT